MTIYSTTRVKSYEGNGVATLFPSVFSCFAIANIKAKHLVVATGVETDLVQDTDFTVAMNGLTTCNITYPKPSSGRPTLPSGEKIYIYRDVPLLQGLDLRNGDDFDVELIEKQFDLLTMMLQALQEEVDRSVKVSITSPSTPDELMRDIADSVSIVSGSADTAATAAAAAAVSAGSAAVSAVEAAASAYIQPLTANRTYYVRTDGSDSNTGLANTSAGAFATLQKAVDGVAGLNLNGYAVTIQVADGTYTAGASLVGALTGATALYPLTIQGNTTTPANCCVTVADGTCFNVEGGAEALIKGFKLSTTGASGECLNAGPFGKIIFGYMEFGACAHVHRQVIGGRIESLANTSYVISGGAVSHVHVTNCGYQLFHGPCDITVSGTPAFSSYFAGVGGAAFLHSSSDVTFTGSATGQKFVVHNTSAIKTGGIVPASYDYFPGNVPGDAYGDGSYDDYNTRVLLNHPTLPPLSCTNLGEAPGISTAQWFGARAVGAASNQQYHSFFMSNNAGSPVEYVRLSTQSTAVTAGTETGGYIINTRKSGTLAAVLYVGHGATTPVVRPFTDNVTNLGAPTARWTTVYATTGTIDTSDAREKNGITALTDAELAASKELAREIGTYRFLTALAEKGDAARVHVGLTVQRAIEIMKEHGLDPFAYGFICHDQWEDQYDTVEVVSSVLDENREELVPAVHEVQLVLPSGDRFSFRHNELLLFLARGFEARLAALEGK